MGGKIRPALGHFQPMLVKLLAVPHKSRARMCTKSRVVTSATSGRLGQTRGTTCLLVIRQKRRIRLAKCTIHHDRLRGSGHFACDCMRNTIPLRSFRIVREGNPDKTALMLSRARFTCPTATIRHDNAHRNSKRRERPAEQRGAGGRGRPPDLLLGQVVQISLSNRRAPSRSLVCLTTCGRLFIIGYPDCPRVSGRERGKRKHALEAFVWRLLSGITPHARDSKRSGAWLVAAMQLTGQNGRDPHPSRV